MKKTNFLRLLDLMFNVDKDMVVLEKLGVDLQDCSFTKCLHEMFDLVIEETYNKEGLDLVLWFIYEKRASLRATDKDGNEIIKTKDELYDYLEANHVSR